MRTLIYMDATHSEMKSLWHHVNSAIESNLVFFQNKDMFTYFDELHELDKLTHA